MQTILRWLANLNEWYDKLTEPKRFIVAVLYGLFPFMLLSTFSTASGEPIFNIFGLLWIAIFVIAFRAWWLYGNLRNYLL